MSRKTSALQGSHQCAEPPDKEGSSSELLSKEGVGEADQALHQPPPGKLQAVHLNRAVRVEGRLK